MKKILLVLNGANTVNTVAFGCYLAGLAKARLVALFPDEQPYGETPALKELHGFAYVETITAADLPDRDAARKNMEQQMFLFNDICDRKAVHAGIHVSRSVSAAEIIRESRYADLMIVDAAAAAGKKQEEQRNRILKELLAAAECPVIVAPAGTDTIEEVVFCYDGSASAFFAMKQFVYLFPGLEEAKATVLEADVEGEGDQAEIARIREWLSGYYNFTDLVVLKGKPEKELFNFLLRKKRALVVMGAYGRSVVSRFFHRSQADLLMNTLAFPVFITHH